MGRQHRGGSEAFEPVQRVEVVPEGAVWVVQHRGSGAQNRVPGQHRAVRAILRQVEAQRIRGVARRRQNPDVSSGRPDGFAVLKRGCTVAVGGVRGPDRCARQGRKPLGGRGVVRVPVRDQDEFDRSLAGQRLKVRPVEGPGVDGDPCRRPRGGNEIGVGSIQAHGARIRGEAEPGQLTAADNAAGCLGGHGPILALNRAPLAPARDHRRRRRPSPEGGDRRRALRRSVARPAGSASRGCPPRCRSGSRAAGRGWPRWSPPPWRPRNR
ncbi:hypothetical protein SRABI128_04940 [Microbacterium sp. Bi128]|nr:hypothetical protein SRABI128_04940 [Microbacterium sp. Bi128]